MVRSPWTLTAEEYAVQQEMLTYDYAKEHALLAAAAVKNGNWAAGSDLFGHKFRKGGGWETFEKFLEHEKMYPTTRPHYQILLDRYEVLRPKK
jgi:hypothetical protein